MPDVDHCLSLERPDAGKHLVKKNAGREDIRTFVGTFAFGLLGRRVGCRTVGNAELCYFSPVETTVLVGLLILEQLRQSKIQDLGLTARRDHDISSLDISMDYVL